MGSEERNSKARSVLQKLECIDEERRNVSEAWIVRKEMVAGAGFEPTTFGL